MPKVKAHGENIKVPKYILNSKSPEYIEAYKQYKQLAKQADQRLVRIENNKDDRFKTEELKRYAYSRAIKDIQKAWGGFNRFNTKAPNTLQGLRAKIADITTFLESPTSTKQGVKESYQKRADTLNRHIKEREGEGVAPVTWQELANFFEITKATLHDQKYGSATTMVAIAKIKRYKITEDNAEKFIGDVRKANSKVHIDILEKEVIKYLIEEQGINYNSLRKGS